MNQERLESLLMTIDRLRATTVRQLSRIHDLGSYRNACRVVNQLEPYTHQQRQQEKIIYLNKEGRGLIGSNREVKFSPVIQHTLLANEAYIYFNCPIDWRTECLLEVEEKAKGLTFNIGSTALKPKSKQLISDAVFTRNGYVHLIEIDNTRYMQDNIKKIKSYADVWSAIKNKYQMDPILYFFTSTENRKRKLLSACKGIRAEVLTFEEIR